MGDKLIGLDELKLMNDSRNKEYRVESVSMRDIAVIGMACRIASANNVDEFWQGLINGKDFIRSLPKNRRRQNEEIIKRLPMSGGGTGNIKYNEWAFLDDIERFDYEFFNISPKEAGLMDPNQRQFLQIVWKAIEEAGYGGITLLGSRTGVFAGYSSDSTLEYKNLISIIDPLSIARSRPGNIKSIITSRIAYILNFRGPSILVDTACSSALVAVHLACQAIRNGECEMAVAGGVKLEILHVKGEQVDWLGIESSTGRTKTFDDSSDGTGGGEGVGAIVLKPLNKALNDGDHIHAVIKGSAVNQDGSSVGITAPNPEAQEDVILQAWKNSRVDPDTITYIEAHGTGTKLGDPVEIDSITKAFRNYTDRKQFCAVASVKTNVGHLDHAAGIAGLIKAICALKYGQIPSSLHFDRPNRKINFEESPVYINNRTVKWETDGFPRRCGVSSFGLSGTNCHMIMEQASDEVVRWTVEGRIKGNKNTLHIFTLSAKSGDVLQLLVDRYTGFLGQCTGVCIDDLCYTANTGRGHYNFRLAVTAGNMEDLLHKLVKISESGIESNEADGIYCRKHSIVSRRKKFREKGEILQEEKNRLDREAAEKIVELSSISENNGSDIINSICKLYINGADINWKGIYKGKKLNRISLPTYPFNEVSCWLEAEETVNERVQVYMGSINHPLIDGILVESFDTDIYLSVLKVGTHWVLSEHKVFGNFVVPGTAYIEMVRAIGSRYYPDNCIELKDVVFISPLSVKETESRSVQTVIYHQEGYKEFVIASKDENMNRWIRHAQGKIFQLPIEKPYEKDFKTLLSRFESMQIVEFGQDFHSSGPVETGPRWNNLKKVYIGDDEGLACIELNETFMKDLDSYHIHPALLDCAVNIAKPDNNDAFYLPLSYKSIKIYRQMPEKILNHVKKKNKLKENSEMVSFDIKLMDESGGVIAEIMEYTVKKVRNKDVAVPSTNKSMIPCYKIGWIPMRNEPDVKKQITGTVLVIKNGIPQADELNKRIISSLERDGCEVIKADMGDSYLKVDDNSYFVGNTEEDYSRLLSECRNRNITQIIHLAAMSGDGNYSDFDNFKFMQESSIFSLYYIVRALLSNRYKQELDFVLIADYAYDTGEEQIKINPLNAAMFGLAKVVSAEYANIKCRCIDIDEGTSADTLIKELYSKGSNRITAYRNGVRYIEEFGRIEKVQEFEDRIEIKNTGAYIIIGGTGGIGLEIGKYFALKNRVNLCLINRSKMPDREKWDVIIDAKENIKMCGKINSIKQIEQSGSKVICYSSDATNISNLNEVIHDIRKKFGRINGVIHSAGIAGNGFIILKKEEVFREVIAPKISGTWILDKLTENDNLDFFVVFSSVASLLGAPGQGDYTAANSFLDSFASYRSRKHGRTLTINWPAWSETGMAFENGISGDDSIFGSLSTLEAIDVFDLLINLKLTRVIPASLKYELLNSYEGELPLKISDNIKSMRSSGETAVTRKTLHSDIKGKVTQIILRGKLKGDYSEYERKVAGYWCGVLGLKEIDIYESFYNVGGDSILATNLMRDMEKEFGSILDITDIFSYPTVSELAEYFEKQIVGDESQVDENREEDIDEVLRKLSSGELSVDDADKLIRLED